MSPVLRKEIRLLTRAWIVAVAAVTIPVWLFFTPEADFQFAEQLIFVSFAGGVLLLSLSTFGSEMSLATFPSLLAQPRPRVETWRRKIGLLAVASILLLVAALFSWWLRNVFVLSYFKTGAGWGYGPFRVAKGIGDISTTDTLILLFLGVTAFVGGLWATLVFRQVSTAFWVSILVPLILYWPEVSLVSDRWLDWLAVGVCGYGVAGYALARWLFMRAEDAHVGPLTGAAQFRLMPTFGKARWPVAALLSKEIRLQHGTFFIAVILAVLHLASMAAPRFFMSAAQEEKVLGGFCFIWWIAPLLVGCEAIAEERRAQTLDGAHCLPVGRLVQFAVKMLVALSLGLFLGAVMPVAIEKLGMATGLKVGNSPNLDFSTWLLTSMVITALGCFASSLSVSALQAIGTAIAVAALSPVVVWLFEHFVILAQFPVSAVMGRMPDYDLGEKMVAWAFGQHPGCSWMAVSAVALAASCVNYKQSRIDWRQLVRHTVIAAALLMGFAIVAVLSAAILRHIFPSHYLR